ncbi:ATP-dependent DNA helicase [Lacrimispora sp.]|uniref:ATP-dependent DNA helicase n=1 Tax=Lacrimispora sp. TaxID=2719234 RepID=UPI00289A1091|nr:ATP-dependent DNA helicase [Lacrimispora sp.]
MNEPVYMADIQNKLHEAGLFRPEERIVLSVENCVLLEYYTGKNYSYRMVELSTLKAKRIFSTQKPLAESGYQRALDKMISQTVDVPNPDRPDFNVRAKNLLQHIFENILPRYGMDCRKNQIDLALEMLQALQENKLALCEAEVGTGKTHAYILAVVIHNLFSKQKLPTVISTSTIALQKALTEEYIPQISEILLEHRIIDKPLSFVVRKGKSHYACDSRVKGYQSSISHNGHKEDKELLHILNGFFTGSHPLDLDGLPLTDYVKARICVERCDRNCSLYPICRYRGFIRKALSFGYDFQITNHNLILADVLSRKNGRNHLFPQSGVIIFDEAHKLLDAARQMYGMTLENGELERLTVSVYHAIGGNNPDKAEIVKLCEGMLLQNTLLFEALKKAAGISYDKNCYAIEIDLNCILALKALKSVLRRLSVLFFTTSREKRERYDRLVSRMEKLDVKLSILRNYSQSVLWLELTGAVACRVCALPKQLDYLLFEDMWSENMPYILTSATLSVRGDFSRFKRTSGISIAEQNRIFETSKASPFDYQENALLYLPQDISSPSTEDSGYFQSIVEHLENLIRTTYGHTLILFTSYRMMEKVHVELSRRITDFPLFCMGKGRLDAIGNFRKSGNGILCASDSAGEGIDLAGDILSSLIVVRLPFPAPNPVLEYEKSLYDDFYEYLNEVIVPGMLIKLRQWIGRGIRRESDTCVFTILDSRAGRRYRNDILAALPDMPVTDRLSDVSCFIRSKKGNAYFE